MIIQKHIEKKVEVPFIFVEGKLDINCDYFIERINHGIQLEDNKSYKTYIKGKMTNWNFFVKDEQFKILARQLVDFLDQNINLPRYDIKDAWGYRVDEREFTLMHQHSASICGAAIYLNDHEQNLMFPQIKQEIKPEKGKFVLFSGFLYHGCKKNNSKNSKYGISFNLDY